MCDKREPFFNRIMSHNPGQQSMFRRFYSHLNTAVAILQAYDGAMPFAHFIKNYFSGQKKYGSKDRREITGLCYGYFRLGKSYPQLTVADKVVAGYRLSQHNWTDEWLAFFKGLHLPAESPDNIFPFGDYLSQEIDRIAFINSHLVQPDLFLRIRPGQEAPVLTKLEQAALSFTLQEDSLRLTNSAKIDEVLKLNQEVVVQDLNSQRVAKLLRMYKTLSGCDNPAVWDCCAASGGKTILATDVLGPLNVLVSDIRPSIIHNLKRRLLEAGIRGYRYLVGDAASVNPGRQFDLIIADVPCSGSGTWARTPEQLLYFDTSQIETFAKLQSAITRNITQYLKPGGYLLYITCSVFQNENEAQIDGLLQRRLQLVEQVYLGGYAEKADTMFAALLKAS